MQAWHALAALANGSNIALLTSWKAFKIRRKAFKRLWPSLGALGQGSQRWLTGLQSGCLCRWKARRRCMLP